METCVLTLATNASVSVSPLPFTLAIWALAAPAPLSPHTLSWDTRPPRKQLLATLPFTFTPGASTNELRAPEFACPARMLFTFEATYADTEEGKEDGCYVKFVQDNKSRELGLFLTQYATSPSDGENDENDADLPYPPGRPLRLHRLPPLPLLQPRLHTPLLSFRAAPPPQTQTELRYADPYIGLSCAVLKHTYHPAPITNFPGLLAHVNASALGEVYLKTPHWVSNFGTIYSEDRTFVEQSGTLTAPVPLSPHTLSWDTRPPRRELLATLPFASFAFSPGASTNELRTPEFACPARTLFLFEVACADTEEGKENGCYLKFYAASPSDGDGDGENDENDADA
ncbi:hypothetical protein C8R44DRAFT_988458 [Mycena epipterygia]|nr:hypothetical protein C8R44DRAFT_988458 [Mycena epipterygia]